MNRMMILIPILLSAFVTLPFHAAAQAIQFSIANHCTKNNCRLIINTATIENLYTTNCLIDGAVEQSKVYALIDSIVTSCYSDGFNDGKKFINRFYEQWYNTTPKKIGLLLIGGYFVASGIWAGVTLIKRGFRKNGQESQSKVDQ